jgi:hypothetical protein
MRKARTIKTIIKVMEKMGETQISSNQYISPEDENKDVKSDFVQWSIVGDGSFCPSSKTLDILSPGLYEPAYNNRMGEWTLMRMTVNTDELFELPTPEINEILEDLKKFWQKGLEYKKFGILHKRGILLYGDPGCGKSGILQLCMKHIISDLGGLVVNLKDEDTVRGYISLVDKLRQIEPVRPIIVILEDIDSIASEGNFVTSQLLNMLDGIKQTENVVYIATTNYPEKLEERITNRPSRFDRRYYVSPPSEEVRKSYLERKTEGGMEKEEVELWIRDTEGMSLSHLKELLISVKVLETPYEQAINHLKGLETKPRGKGQKKVGFSGN